MKLYCLFLLLAACLAAAQQASSNARVPIPGLTGGTDSSGKRPSRPGINGLHRANGPAWYVLTMIAEWQFRRMASIDTDWRLGTSTSRPWLLSRLSRRATRSPTSRLLVSRAAKLSREFTNRY
jgi:hypothetical protein